MEEPNLVGKRSRMTDLERRSLDALSGSEFDRGMRHAWYRRNIASTGSNAVADYR